MKIPILIAEDNPVAQKVLGHHLTRWGYSVHAVGDGQSAWAFLSESKTPVLVLLDWMMPGLDGIEVIQRVRKSGIFAYIILVTARNAKQDLAQGLEAGADDYVSKPFDLTELRARIRVGIRTLELQAQLKNTVSQLEEALARVRRLHGLLPICAYCKKIRDDQNYWHQVELYISQHADVEFTHGICPDCYKALMGREKSHRTHRKTKVSVAAV